MISRRLDTEGDLVTSGDQFVRDTDCVAQCIQTRLKLFMGECFRNIYDGMPWFKNPDGTPGILTKGYTLQQAEALIRRQIGNTEGVSKLLAFSINYDTANRSLSVYAQALTTFGTTVEVTWAE